MKKIKPGDLLKCGDEYGVYLFEEGSVHVCYWPWGSPLFNLFSREGTTTLQIFRENFFRYT